MARGLCWFEKRTLVRFLGQLQNQNTASLKFSCIVIHDQLKVQNFLTSAISFVFCDS